MGCFRFRKASQRVIKGYFHSFVGTKAIGSSGHHSNLVVGAFDSTSRNLAFGAEPIQQEFLVGAQHASDFLHRLQTATHGPIAPVVKKSSNPDHGFVAPEVEEGFLQLPGAGWPATLTDAELLERLLALNHQRAARSNTDAQTRDPAD